MLVELSGFEVEHVQVALNLFYSHGLLSLFALFCPLDIIEVLVDMVLGHET